MGGSLIVQIIGHTAVGAASSVTASATEQLITKGEVDWGTVGYSAISGGVSGGATKGLSGLWSKVKGAANAQYYTKTGEPIWPKNDGFAGTPKTQTLKPGMLVDRYGGSTGQYVSPKGTPFEMRSLPSDAEIRPYNVYEVVRPIEVKAG